MNNPISWIAPCMFKKVNDTTLEKRKSRCDSPWCSAYAAGTMIASSNTKKTSTNLHRTVAPPPLLLPTATTRRESARRESRAMFLRLDMAGCLAARRTGRNSRKRHDNNGHAYLASRTLFARWLSRVCRSCAYHTLVTDHPARLATIRVDCCDTSEISPLLFRRQRRVKPKTIEHARAPRCTKFKRT